MSTRAFAIALIVVFAIVAPWSLWASGPPPVIPKSAPPAEVSAERALEHVAAIAQRPHPVGSADHDRVRDYVVGELRRLGLSPEVQTAVGAMPKHRTMALVQNIVARMRGTSGATDAVLLASHYDSVPAGPGAGDDAAGVAAVLEALRALRAGPPLKNDVIVLVSDAEEAGLVGAAAFMDQHPWAKDVRATLNFEARGTRGSSVMFQTSAGNAPLIDMLAHAAPRVSATSLSYEVYRRMPNDTDMTVFLAHGAAGLNFAFIGGWEGYHTPFDDLEHLDRGSLQQHASYALGMTCALGDADLSRLQTKDEVYFALPGSVFVHYSVATAWVLAGLAIAGLFAVIAAAVRAKVARTPHVLFSLLLGFGVVAAAGALGAGLAALVGWGQGHGLPDGDTLRSAPYAAATALLAGGLWLAASARLAKAFSWPSVASGAALGIAVLLVASTAKLVGASYVFLVPVAVAAASIAIASRPVTPLRAAGLALLALPVVMLDLPHAVSIFDGLGFNPVGAAAVALVAALGSAALTTQLAPIVTAFPRAARAVPLAAGGLVLVYAAITTRYDAAHPKPSTMVYALDADAKRARWESSAAHLDAWTAAYVGASPARDAMSLGLRFSPHWLGGEAPALDLPAPTVTMNSSTDTGAGDTRDVQVTVQSPRGARELLLVLSPSVTTATVGGIGVTWMGAGYEGNTPIRFVNLPHDGVVLKLAVARGKPLKITALDGTLGLPAVPGPALPARPVETMQHHWGDQTTVKTVRAF